MTKSDELVFRPDKYIGRGERGESERAREKKREKIDRQRGIYREWLR